MIDPTSPTPLRTTLVPAPSLTMLSVSSDRADLRGRWTIALERFGYAFVAYSQLQRLELFTVDAEAAFESSFRGSFQTLDDVVRVCLDEIGWSAVLEQLRRQHGIASDLLIWNREAIIAQLESNFDICHAGGQIHLFLRY